MEEENQGREGEKERRMEGGVWHKEVLLWASKVKEEDIHDLTPHCKMKYGPYVSSGTETLEEDGQALRWW